MTYNWFYDIFVLRGGREVRVSRIRDVNRDVINDAIFGPGSTIWIHFMAEYTLR